MSISKIIKTITLAGTIVCCSSCVIEEGRDLFRDTSWESTEHPLGPLDVDTLTVEFLTNGTIILNTTSKTASTSLSDTYLHDDCTAVLNGLTLNVEGIDITFVEMHYGKDVAFILWRPEDVLKPFTTALYRKR